MTFSSLTCSSNHPCLATLSHNLVDFLSVANVIVGEILNINSLRLLFMNLKVVLGSYWRSNCKQEDQTVIGEESAYDSVDLGYVRGKFPYTTL